MDSKFIISICWIIFLIFWLAVWGWSKPTQKKQSNRGRKRYIISLLLGAVLLNISSPTAHSIFATVIFSSTHTLAIVANVMAIAGLIIAIWARITLGANWSGSVQIKKGHELVTSGPYRFVRHPIYTAVFLLFLATALDYGTVGGFLAFIFFFLAFWLKLRQEERYMLEQFPHDYPAYMQHVKRLIPFVF